MPTTADAPDQQLDGVLAALANPARRRILDLLAEQERPVKDLAEVFTMSRPAVSQHLRILLDARLVSEHRAGRERHYRLEPERLWAVRQWLRTYDRFWTERLKALGEYLEHTP